MALRVINYLLSLPPQAKGVKISEESSLHKGQRKRTISVRPIKWEHAKAKKNFRIRPRRSVEILAPTVNILLLVIQALAKEGRSEDILTVIARVRERHVEPNFMCYMAAITAFDDNSDDWQSAVKLLIQMQRKGLRRGLTRALKVALKTCLQKERYDLIKKLVDQALINPRFSSNTPLMVQGIALVAAFKMKNEEWAASLTGSKKERCTIELRGQAAQAVRGKEGEEQAFRNFANMTGFYVKLVK